MIPNETLEIKMHRTAFQVYTLSTIIVGTLVGTLAAYEYYNPQPSNMQAILLSFIGGVLFSTSLAHATYYYRRLKNTIT